MFHIVFVEPRIPPNTGNAIRLAAATGAHLHLVEPLGFTMTDAQLRRAGLDYHDLAQVTVHPTLAALWAALLPARVFAFTTRATTRYTDVDYRAGDALMFGAEPDGLPAAVLADPQRHRAAAHPHAARAALDEPGQLRLDRGLRGLAPGRVRRSGLIRGSRAAPRGCVPDL